MGLAVRWTSHPAIQRLIRAHGEPMTSTSANRPGVPPAMTVGEILAQWPDAQPFLGERLGPATFAVDEEQLPGLKQLLASARLPISDG